ncbi:MAG: hypothetical protein Q7T18_00075 [Sedimentisphaerales bacterium]|nr:hypothetical protein [Sedimentisphaerales bacterium]
MSTPILWGGIYFLSSLNQLASTIIANLIGGLIFFWVDKFIFTSPILIAQWEIQENIACCDCGQAARGYRLVKTHNYDRSKALPQFRCEICSQRKTEELRKKGVVI